MNKFNFVFCFVACFAILAPRAALAQDAGAAQPRVIADDEVNRCIEDCKSKTQACPTEEGLKKCQEDLKSCREVNEIWRVAYAKLVDACGGKFEKLAKPGEPVKTAPPKPAKPAPVVVDDDKVKKPPPPPPKLEAPVVLCMPPAVKSQSGHGCECEDGFPARVLGDNEGRGWKEAKCVFTVEDVRHLLVPLNKHFEGVCQPGQDDRPNELQAACDQTGRDVLTLMAWYRGLVLNGTGKPLTRDAWIKVWDTVSGLEKRLKGIEDRLAKLETAQEQICPVVPDHPESNLDMGLRCAYWREQYLAKPAAAGPFKGGLEWEAGASFGYLHRPGAALDTGVVGGVLGLTGWVNDWHGMRVRGLVGYGAHSDTPRLVTGAEVAYRLAFDKTRAASLAAGLQGTVEPSNRGNEASNLGVKLGVQLRPAPNFFIEPEVVVSASRPVQYAPDGSGARRLSDWGGPVFQPGISLGAVF